MNLHGLHGHHPGGLQQGLQLQTGDPRLLAAAHGLQHLVRQPGGPALLLQRHPGLGLPRHPSSRLPGGIPGLVAEVSQPITLVLEVVDAVEELLLFVLPVAF